MKKSALCVYGSIACILLILCASLGQATNTPSVSTAKSENISYGPEKISHHNIKNENVDLLAWHPNYRERCYIQGRENSQTENIATIIELLALFNENTVFGKYFLNVLQEADSAVCIDNRADETRGYYDFKYNVIAVREHLELLEKLIILIHEIRHVDQFLKGFYYSLDYAMEEIVRTTFAIEADVQAIVTLFAWRIKEQEGTDVLWRTLSGFKKYADISEAFEKEMLASSSEVKATRAAFSQWYKSEWRLNCYFKNTCSIYLDLLDDTKYIQKYSKLPEDYFDELCTLPSGRNYYCHTTDEIQENPRSTIKKIRKINHSTLD